jgi:hypothetical protein
MFPLGPLYLTFTFTLIDRLFWGFDVLDSEMEGDAQPVCYSIPDNPQVPLPQSKTKHQLHGADDLITLFDLKPLWERSVKPYTAAGRAKQKEQVNVGTDGNKGDEQGLDSNKNATGSSLSNDQNKPLVMEKTYVNYVRDLPGTSVCTFDPETGLSIRRGSADLFYQPSSQAKCDLLSGQ